MSAERSHDRLIRLSRLVSEAAQILQEIAMDSAHSPHGHACLHCEACRQWEQAGDHHLPDHGYCRRFGTPTRADFGCTEWKSR